jgi:hypothetical protein
VSAKIVVVALFGPYTRSNASPPDNGGDAGGGGGVEGADSSCADDDPEMFVDFLWIGDGSDVFVPREARGGVIGAAVVVVGTIAIFLPPARSSSTNAAGPTTGFTRTATVNLSSIAPPLSPLVAVIRHTAPRPFLSFFF